MDLGLPEERYRLGCLTGFGRAEECTAAVGQRVLDVLTNQPGLSSDPVDEAMIRWLKAEMAPTRHRQPRGAMCTLIILPRNFFFLAFCQLGLH